MTAPSELFVEEIVRDCVEEILKVRGFEIECPKDWMDIWSPSDYPATGRAKIVDYAGNVIGEVEWETIFFIEEGICGRFIDAEPKITRLVWKGRTIIE